MQIRSNVTAGSLKVTYKLELNEPALLNTRCYNSLQRITIGALMLLPYWPSSAKITLNSTPMSSASRGHACCHGLSLHPKAYSQIARKHYPTRRRLARSSLCIRRIVEKT